jgi:hypothetical protein
MDLLCEEMKVELELRLTGSQKRGRTDSRQSEGWGWRSLEGREELRFLPGRADGEVEVDRTE